MGDQDRKPSDNKKPEGNSILESMNDEQYQEVSPMTSKDLSVVIAGVIIMIFLFGFLCDYPLANMFIASIIASIFCVFCWYFWYEELGINFESYVQMIEGANIENQEENTIEKIG